MTDGRWATGAGRRAPAVADLSYAIGNSTGQEEGGDDAGGDDGADGRDGRDPEGWGDTRRVRKIKFLADLDTFVEYLPARAIGVRLAEPKARASAGLTRRQGVGGVPHHAVGRVQGGAFRRRHTREVALI